MIPTFDPILANALQFAFEKATTEGKITIATLLVVSLFSWTVIIRKARQLYRAQKMSRHFYAAYRRTREPLELFQRGGEFPGAPAFEVYLAGAEELTHQLKHHALVLEKPLRSTRGSGALSSGAVAGAEALGRGMTKKISAASFESVKVVLERAVGAQALSLEKGMIILSTAVAGGPFLGLLGTVWGVMETFSGIARVQAASLTAMAPGVAGALIATVVGLFVAIPAMFAYNYMITTIRAITQELDNFTAEYATAIEHAWVDHRPVSAELLGALWRLERRQGAGRPDEREPALT